MDTKKETVYHNGAAKFEVRMLQGSDKNCSPAVGPSVMSGAKLVS